MTPGFKLVHGSLKHLKLKYMSKKLTTLFAAGILGGLSIIAVPVIDAATEKGVQPLADTTGGYVFESDFSTAAGLDGWTIINSNEDEKKWYYDDGQMRIDYNTSEAMDDWLITPAITLQGNTNYTLVFKVKGQSSSYPEQLEIKYGQTNDVDGMSELLMETTVISNTDYVTKKIGFTVNADGDYFIGFHGVSERDKYYLFLNDIKVYEGNPEDGPTVEIVTVTPPYSSNFSRDGLEGWTVIDVNEDSKTWTKSGEEIQISYHSSNKMDDWLITPGLEVEKGKIYKVSFDTKCYGSSYPEKIEVKCGTNNTVSAMTETLLEETEVNSGEYTTYSFDLIPTEESIYFVGFHGISDPNQYYLYIKNVTVSEGMSGTSPGKVTNLVITPDAAGALKCNISFTTPTLAYNGDALSSITEVEVKRNDEVVKTFQNPSTGEQLSYDDEPSYGGDITYTIIAKNNDGNGPAVSETVFVGKDKPVGITSATLERVDLNGTATVSWEPVTQDINGKLLTESDVKYRIYKVEQDYYGDPQLKEVLYEGLKGNSHTAQFVEEGNQEFIQVGVVAYTDGGEGDFAVTEKVPVGTPLSGYEESFAHCSLSTPLIYPAGGSVLMDQGGWSNPEPQDDDSGLLIIKMYTEGQSVDITTGLISVEGFPNPTLSFYSYNEYAYDFIKNTIAVSLLPEGDSEWVEIQAPKAEMDFFEEDQINIWGRIMVAIPVDYTSRPFQLRFTIGKDGNVATTYLDNITIEALQDYDMAVTNITAPQSVNAGSDYSVEVSVKNVGYNPIDSYSVELYKDGVLAETKVMQTIVSQGEEVLSFNVNMSPLAENVVTLYAKVVATSDLDETNNLSEEVEVSPKLSKLPMAESINPEAADEGVVLTWIAPDLASMQVDPYTESFEEGTNGDAEYGDWTFINKDGFEAGFYGMIGYESTDKYGAFFILDSEEFEKDTHQPLSGTHCLFATNPSPNAQYSDDWAISPELGGEAQTIKLWAKSTSTSTYDWNLEQFQILYSEGSLNPDDFILIEESLVEVVPNEWTEYIVELPEGSRYFAIRSFGKNAYQLLIDDVYFAPVSPASFEILGYNIYRDGEKLNDEPVTETTFADNDAPDGTKTYHVTVVYKNRGESRGISAEITTTGVEGFADGITGVYASEGKIIITGAEDMDVVVASLNGALLYNGKGASRLEVAAGKGIYVVKVGNLAKKVIVK